MPALLIEDALIRAAEGRTILEIERLAVRPGEALGVSGPSGAGKTTLLHLIAGLVLPDRGRVLWDGTDIAALGEAARDAFRRRHMGLIFQDFLLIEELSAAENASLTAAFAPAGEREARRARAAALLARLGFAARPTPVARLSGGERQRVAAARALAGSPGILLADEPTASLDRIAADRLIGDLLALAKDEGRTVIVVSHDGAVLDRMDRVIGIRDGRTLAEAA